MEAVGWRAAAMSNADRSGRSDSDAEKETDVRHGRPSKEQLKLNFDSLLARVLEGHGLRTASGLDQETKAALRAISDAHPNVTEELVEAARQAFAGQLDGSNAARWLAENDKELSEMEARSKRSQ
ncbi:hypothetical protein [Nocardia sp. JMUB6875]|uniref:hypothetical protein n=1 Tax=Nocardia sp. JMUB6875 TaxID=3158170 RepID=UPI0034E877EF